MKQTVIVIFAIVLYATVLSAQSIKVAVAANVQYAMKDLREAFEKEFHISVQTIIASSGKLTAQIQHGAPYDIFLSANMKYPQYLFQKGLTLTKPKVYAYGTLVLWSMQRDIDLSKGVHGLLQPNIHKIALANPKNAPYGIQAVRVLQHYQLYSLLQSKLVFGESIAQSNQYIFSQLAEIGFTAKSVVQSPAMKSQGQWVELPAGSYEKIEQGVVLLSYAARANIGEKKKFYTYLFSQQAGNIFKKYGYIVVP